MKKMKKSGGNELKKRKKQQLRNETKDKQNGMKVAKIKCIHGVLGRIFRNIIYRAVWRAQRFVPYAFLYPTPIICSDSYADVSFEAVRTAKIKGLLL